MGDYFDDLVQLSIQSSIWRQQLEIVVHVTNAHAYCAHRNKDIDISDGLKLSIQNGLSIFFKTTESFI